MFLACQINSCCLQPEGFEKKLSEKQLSFTVIASLYKHSAVYATRHGLACALFLFFFLYYMKAIDEEICPSGFRNCYIYFKTATIVFISLRPAKSQINFRKSQKISNIYLKRSLSYSSLYLPNRPNRVKLLPRKNLAKFNKRYLYKRI